MTFTDITPETGWQLNFDRVGYYTHASRAYLSGIVLSTVDGTTTSLILTVPPAVRPASPVSLTLPVTIESDFTRDTALNFAASYSATLYADGTLVLDALPDQAVNTPDPTVYKWKGLSGTFRGRYPRPLYLGLLLGGVSWAIGGGSDTYSSGSLAAHIGAHFTDIDSTYSVHGERVHLGGSVSANVDGASVLLSSLPSDAIAGLSGGDSFGTEVDSGGQKYPLEIDGTSEAYVDEDSTIKAAGDSPPLTWACPRFQTPVSDTEFGGSVLPIGQNFISGSTPGVLEDGASVDHGTYSCSDGMGGSATCRNPGSVPDLTVSLSALLAQCDPPADWFLLHIDYRLNVVQQANDGACHGGDTPCGALLDAGLSLSVTAGAGFSLVAADGTPVPPTGTRVQAYMAPTSPAYTGDTELPSTIFPNDGSFVWQAGQISGSITAAAGATVNVANPGLGVFILPLYEDRQLGLRSGDVVDLTGAGWPGEASPAGSTIAAGTPTTGIIRLG